MVLWKLIHQATHNFNLVLHVAMVIFVKKDNKKNLWYVQNAIVIAGHVM